MEFLSCHYYVCYYYHLFCSLLYFTNGRFIGPYQGGIASGIFLLWYFFAKFIYFAMHKAIVWWIKLVFDNFNWFF